MQRLNADSPKFGKGQHSLGTRRPRLRVRPAVQPVDRQFNPSSRESGDADRQFNPSSPRKRGPIRRSLSSKQFGPIPPIHVVFFNQPNLPVAIPFLELFFTRNRLIRSVKPFHMNKPVHSVFLRECVGSARSVLTKAPGQVVRDTNVQGAVSTTRQNVDEILCHQRTQVVMGPRLRGDDNISCVSRSSRPRPSATCP